MKTINLSDCQKQNEKIFTMNYREEMIIDTEVKNIVEKEAKRVNSTPEEVFETLFDLVYDELAAVKEESGTENPTISLSTVKELLEVFKLNDLSI